MFSCEIHTGGLLSYHTQRHVIRVWRGEWLQNRSNFLKSFDIPACIFPAFCVPKLVLTASMCVQYIEMDCSQSYSCKYNCPGRVGVDGPSFLWTDVIICYLYDWKRESFILLITPDPPDPYGIPWEVRRFVSFLTGLRSLYLSLRGRWLRCRSAHYHAWSTDALRGSPPQVSGSQQTSFL